MKLWCDVVEDQIDGSYWFYMPSEVFLLYLESCNRSNNKLYAHVIRDMKMTYWQL